MKAAFSRKHYEMVAQVIDAEMVTARGQPVLERLAAHFADVFAADNAQFDRVRFLAACGFER